MPLDEDLVDRLRLVSNELGGRQLPIFVVIRALLTERLEYLEAHRARSADTLDGETTVL